MEQNRIERYGVSYSNQPELNLVQNKAEYIPTRYERVTWSLMQKNPNYPGVLSREARTSFERESILLNEPNITDVPSYTPRVEVGQLAPNRLLQVISTFSKLII